MMNLPNTIKQNLSQVFTEKQKKQLQNIYVTLFYSQNLKKLATLYDSDKWGEHYYAQHYEKYFSPLRNKKLNILEIGIGGYDNPQSGGASLRMWRDYFPNSMIYGIDIYDKQSHEEKRIKTFKGSQTDPDFLKEVFEKIGHLDIIIDDGSHINDHVITTFNILFPLLDKQGIYMIEDTQTSYWESYGGTTNDLNSKSTIMGFFKSLVDGLNHEEFLLSEDLASYFDKHIIAIHFYHNLIVIQKGENNEGSNVKKR